MDAQPAACDSCGDEVPGLVEVHRIYVTWDESGAIADERVVEDTEQWCAVCRTQYPHEVRADASG